jgi:oligogalacturonide lyase
LAFRALILFTGVRAATVRATICYVWGLVCPVVLLSGGLGRDWGVERESYVDPVTSARVWELTKGTNRADNLYFHVSNFTADNRYLLFVSDRTGAAQLYRAEVETGRLVQLTDEPAINARAACPDHTNARRVYYLRGAEVMALDILDFSARKVGEIPRPYTGGFQQPSLSQDGKLMALAKQRDDANWEIGLMDTQTGAYRTVLTQGFRIGHVQHSPTAPLIFYVWETGGYAPQRTWLVNEDGTGNRPFYARTNPTNWFTPLKEWVTHEAWVKDTGEMTMINDKVGVMLVSKDGNARLVREGSFWHAAARPDGKFIVADDFQGRLWLIETATSNARLLATGLRDTVRVHPHPSFDRQGRYVQFHTGRTHETVALIDLTQLPASEWVR